MSDQRSGPEGMSITRLQAILDAYGADSRRWPAAERAAAEALLECSAEARASRDRAAGLDRLLSASTVPQPSPALRDAILRAARRPAPALAPGAADPQRTLWRSLLGALTGELGGLRPAGAGVGLALLLGAVAGGAVETGSADGTSFALSEQNLDFVQLALFDDSYGEF